MHFLLSDRFMNAVVLNRARSVRVLLDSEQGDTSFRWIEGEAPSDYADELCSFADNVKSVLMHGLSWYQFKVQHGDLISADTTITSAKQKNELSHVHLLADCVTRVAQIEAADNFHKKNHRHHPPQNEVVASRLRSRGGAHLDHIPWHAG